MIERARWHEELLISFLILLSGLMFGILCRRVDSDFETWG